MTHNKSSQFLCFTPTGIKQFFGCLSIQLIIYAIPYILALAYRPNYTLSLGKLNLFLAFLAVVTFVFASSYLADYDNKPVGNYKIIAPLVYLLTAAFWLYIDLFRITKPCTLIMSFLPFVYLLMIPLIGRLDRWYMQRGKPDVQHRKSISTLPSVVPTTYSSSQFLCFTPTGIKQFFGCLSIQLIIYAIPYILALAYRPNYTLSLGKLNLFLAFVAVVTFVFASSYLADYDNKPVGNYKIIAPLVYLLTAAFWLYIDLFRISKPAALGMFLFLLAFLLFYVLWVFLIIRFNSWRTRRGEPDASQ